MAYIDKNNGRFVTIVPDTRRETTEFSEQLYNSEVRWKYLTKKQSTRRKGKYDVFHVADSLFQLEEGYRVYWYKSSEKLIRDKESRADRLVQAFEKLRVVAEGKRRGPKTVKGYRTAADKVLDKHKVKDMIKIEVTLEEEVKYKRCRSDDPNAKGRYEKISKKVPRLRYSRNQAAIDRDKAMDGIFPLVTNTKLNAAEVLDAYKYQPNLEKIFAWLKSYLDIAPAFLKKVERIEGLMFACYVADLIRALIQRELRMAMKEAKIESLRTLPEKRQSKTPTWEQVRRLFEHHSKFELRERNTLVKRFFDDLSSEQKEVLSMLKIPIQYYSE